MRLYNSWSWGSCRIDMWPLLKARWIQNVSTFLGRIWTNSCKMPQFHDDISSKELLFVVHFAHRYCMDVSECFVCKGARCYRNRSTVFNRACVSEYTLWLLSCYSAYSRPLHMPPHHILCFYSSYGVLTVLGVTKYSTSHPRYFLFKCLLVHATLIKKNL